MEHILAAIVGIVCIVIGISNRKGNLSMLHSYHKNNVSEEDRIPFGKLVGVGMIIVGVALAAYGGLCFASDMLQEAMYATVGNAVLIIGLVVGLGLAFFAMKKYNKR